MTRALTWAKGLTEFFKGPMLAMFALGYSSGMGRALIFGTLTFWLSEEGLSRTSVGLFAAVNTPYALKFLWSPFVDRLPLPFLTALLGRRRSWLVLSQVVLIGLIIMMAGTDPATDPLMTAYFALMIGFAGATQDIVIDAFRIETLEERKQGHGVAMYVFGYRLALLAAGAGALMLSGRYGWQTTYLVLGASILIGMTASLLSKEPQFYKGIYADEAATSRWHEITIAFRNSVVAPFKEFMTRNGWLWILVFALLFKLGDAMAGAMTNKFVEELFVSGKVGDELIAVKDQLAGIYKGIGFIAILAGTAVAAPMIYALGLYRALMLAAILQLVSNFMFAVQAQVGDSMMLLAATIGFENFASGMGGIMFIGYLSGQCHKAYTATQYALLSSFTLVASTWLSTPSGWLADQLDWFWFFNMTAMAAAPGLLLLLWLGRLGLISREKAKAN